MVMPNLYGNIVNNVCAGLVGGPGLVAGANYGHVYAVFETVSATSDAKAMGLCELELSQSVQSLSHVRLFASPWTASMLVLPVHHQFPELAQTHVHRVGDAIQPSHPLSPPSPPALNLSQHQGLFK